MKTKLEDIPSELLPLIPDYLSRRKEDMNMLKSSFATRQLESCKFIGHKLKGCGTSYGFPYLSELGAGIELAAQENRLDSLTELIHNYELEVNEILEKYEESPLKN